MRNICTAILYILLAASCRSLPASSVEALDEEIGRKEEYDARKEERISRLRESLGSAASEEERYSIIGDLYREYRSYKSDSAYAYAGRMIAGALTPDQKAEARCCETFCLLSTGYFKEAFEAAGKIPSKGISPKAKERRYDLLIHLNYSAADYNATEPYHDQYIRAGHIYSDSLLALLPEGSSKWHYCHANRNMKARRWEESILEFTPLAESPDVELHDKAVITSCIGWMYMQLGKEDLAEKYVAQAAVYDLQTSTKETTALRMLAEMLAAKGETLRPAVYVRNSLEDANFYDAKLRKLQTGSILPIIEQNRYEIISRQRNILLAGILLAVLILLAAAAVMWFIKAQNKRLDEARRTIEERKLQLEQANASLAEANEIKAEYIGNSFYINSEFIGKMSQLYKMVDRMIVTRQYDELRRSLKESALSEERDRMFDSFDSTFLKIFPTFINDYNALFPEAEQRFPAKGLTTEMRIFALIRLGISESDRIAKFLDFSVHTVNTYKTRVKNKSWVENELFEGEIMKTGLRQG